MNDKADIDWTGEELSDEQLVAITSVLQTERQFNIGFYKDRCMRRRIAKRLRICGANNVQEYLFRLQDDPCEIDALLETLSIHVSQFFRNPATFHLLERTILPNLAMQVRVDRGRHLRLWSVGCASGEETYSLALLIDDLDLKGLNVEILGTDISNKVLDIARQGLYGSARLREIPADVLAKYFSQEDDKFRLNERIRNLVRFEQHDLLMADNYPPADLILCRNVLIYLSRSEQERVLKRFFTSLSSFGRLVLGRSETMVGSLSKHFHAEFPVERVYRKAGTFG